MGILKTDKEGILIIPKGYKWCMDCNALTPHEKEKENDKYSQRVICKVCSHNLDDEYDCPNCGHSATNEIEGPETIEVPVHVEDCPVLLWERQENERVKEQIDQAFLMTEWEPIPEPPECNCPKETIYPSPNIFNTWSRVGNTMICFDAQEWGGEIRCPICGTIYDYEDGNC